MKQGVERTLSTSLKRRLVWVLLLPKSLTTVKYCLYCCAILMTERCIERHGLHQVSAANTSTILPSASACAEISSISACEKMRLTSPSAASSMLFEASPCISGRLVRYRETALTSSSCLRNIWRNSGNSIWPLSSLSYCCMMSASFSKLTGSPICASSWPISIAAIVPFPLVSMALNAASYSLSLPSRSRPSYTMLVNSAKSIVPLLSLSYCRITASNSPSGSQYLVRIIDVPPSKLSRRLCSSSRSILPSPSTSNVLKRSCSADSLAASSGVMLSSHSLPSAAHATKPPRARC
mmetsp:Transcript_40882/g.122056  ORF Transcript_40882/g.122056 Transcript_40882/m.122056 type:complete len:294 (-) Transcript_40882:719-1600(-)